MTLLLLVAAYAAIGAIFVVPLLEFSLCGVMTLGLLWFLVGSSLAMLEVDITNGSSAVFVYVATIGFQAGFTYLLFGLRTKRISLDEVVPLLVFALLFFGAHQLCHMWPDFLSMGERLRDYALLAENMRSPIVAREPWMEGTLLNYYVFWYRLAHALRTLLGFEVWDAYHALAAYALAAYGAVLYQVVRVVFGGSQLLAVFTAVIVTFGSNLAGFRHWWKDDHSWWGPSRVIKGAINEFPAWSFLLGDLHPHFLNLSIFPLAILLMYRLWTANLALEYRIANTGALALTTVLFLMASNAWEVPMWAGFCVVLAIVTSFAHRATLRQWAIDKLRMHGLFDACKAAGSIFLVIAAVVGVSLQNPAPPPFLKFVTILFAIGFAILFFPFSRGVWAALSRVLKDRRAMLLIVIWVVLVVACKLSGAHIKAEGGALTLVRAPIEVTTMTELFWHWGLPLSVIAVATVGLTLPWGLSVLCGAALAVTAFNDKAILFLYLLAFFQVLRVYDSRDSKVASRPAWAFEEAIALSALGLLLLPEFVFLDDPYGGENERMNTIFKVYTTAWGLIALTAVSLAQRFGSMFLTLQESSGKDASSLRLAVRVVSGALGSCALLLAIPFFPLTASLRKSQPFVTTPYEEGLSEVARKFPGSATIIRELRNRPQGRVLEAQGNPYDYTTFVSTLAAQPAYLGWANHVELLSKQYAEVTRRRDLTAKWYKEPDCTKRKELAKLEQISYIVVGSLEQQKYPEVGNIDFSCFTRIIQERDYSLYSPP
jgi:uncharacterized membrane protein